VHNTNLTFVVIEKLLENTTANVTSYLNKNSR